MILKLFYYLYFNKDEYLHRKLLTTLILYLQWLAKVFDLFIF